MVEELIAKQVRFKKKNGFYRERFKGYLDFEEIVDVILEETETNRKDVFRKCRKKNIAISRQLMCYYAFFLTNLSLPLIGQLLDRDHSTVVHGRDTIIDLNEVQDDEVSFYVKHLNSIFNERITVSV